MEETKFRLIKDNSISLLVGILILIPFLCIFTFRHILPVIQTFMLSFTQWDILTPAKWIGLQNYSHILKDQWFWKYLGNSVWFIVFTVPVLFLATWLFYSLSKKATQPGEAGPASVRSLLILGLASYLPLIVSILWRWSFNPDFGIVNYVLRVIGIYNVPEWLSSQIYVKPTILFFFLAISLPYWCFIGSLFGSAVGRNFNPEKNVKHDNLLLFPLLLLMILSLFETWSPIYCMTGGGPAGSTTTLPYYIFNNMFQWFRFGYGSAMNVPGIVILLILGIILYYYLRKSRLSFGLIPQMESRQKKPNSLLLIISIIVLLPLLIIFIWGLATSIKGEGGIFQFPPRLDPYGQKMIYINKDLKPLFILQDKKTEQTVVLMNYNKKTGICTVAELRKDETPDLSHMIQIKRDELKPVMENRAHWENYRNALSGAPWLRFVFNSLFEGLLQAIGAVLVGGIVAFTLSFLIKPVNTIIANIILLLFLAFIFIGTGQILGSAFVMVKKLNWIDTYAGVNWPQVFSIPVFLLFYLFFEGQKKIAGRDRNLENKSFWKLIVTGIPVLVLFTFVVFIFNAINDFTWNLIVTNSFEMKNMAVGMASFLGLYSMRWNLLSAASMTFWIASLVFLVPLLLLLERFFFRKIVIVDD